MPSNFRTVALLALVRSEYTSQGAPSGAKTKRRISLGETITAVLPTATHVVPSYIFTVVTVAAPTLSWYATQGLPSEAKVKEWYVETPLEKPGVPTATQFVPSNFITVVFWLCALS